MSHHVSTCLIMSPQVSSGYHVSSGLIRSHQVSSGLFMSPLVSSYLNVSHVIVSHRISFALVSSHPFNRIPSHRIISYFSISRIISHIISMHVPTFSTVIPPLQVSGKPSTPMALHSFRYPRFCSPPASSTSVIFYRIFVSIQGISRNIQSVWDRMLQSRWAGNPGFRASEITAAFLKMQMNKPPIMVLLCSFS